VSNISKDAVTDTEQDWREAVRLLEIEIAFPRVGNWHLSGNQRRRVLALSVNDYLATKPRAYVSVTGLAQLILAAQLNLAGLSEAELAGLGTLHSDDVHLAWRVADRARTSQTVLEICAQHWSSGRGRPLLRLSISSGDESAKRRSLCLLITWGLAGGQGQQTEQARKAAVTASAARWSKLLDRWGTDELALAYELLCSTMTQPGHKDQLSEAEVDEVLGVVEVLGVGAPTTRVS
jgi:hypothetical protein